MSDDAPGTAEAEARVGVVHVPQANRFDALLDGERVGWADYVPGPPGRGGGTTGGPSAWEVVHTETVPAYRGRGVAGGLVAALVVAAREAGVQVVPVCPYVAAWFARHPEEAGVLRG